MNETSLIKALLINAACQNATAVCANTAGSEPPIDPLIQDTNLQGKGVMVYEEAKIQYAALLRAFQDQTGVWPDPQIAAGVQSGGSGALANIASAATQVLSALPASTNLASVGGLLQAISALVKTGNGAPVAAPGSEIPAQPPTTAPAAKKS